MTRRRGLSIRAKITLWFSAFLVVIVAITYFVVLFVSNQVIQSGVRDSLVETVEHNVDEIEYYASISEDDLADDVDYFVNYGNGFLEIDDDFLDEINEVYTSLCLADGSLFYGENPIQRDLGEVAFVDGEVQEASVDGITYYIYDRELTDEGLDGLWLRGVVSEERGAVQLTSISKLSLIALPSLVLLAIVGGWLISRRTLRPIQQISDEVAQIREGEDLNRRIDIGEGTDELHQLADQFNAMFERLDESFAAQQQFVSDASHELRTPLSVILVQCELALEDDSPSAEEAREALEVIQRQSKKMSRLVDDMLDITRMELHSERYEKETLDLGELVDDTCSDLALIGENNITLTWDVPKELPVYVHGNSELLTRLLVNLVGNAYRYGQHGGHTQVKLMTDDGEWCRLSVKDDGIGIADDEQKRIFDRFYQVDGSRSSDGSGLGLAMVAEIAEFHGGSVQVESELGKGSTFTVTLHTEISPAEND